LVTMKVLLVILCAAQTWALPKPDGVRIIGGQEATASRFPYAAAIYKSTPSGNYFCTGSFMNYQWILTAGQCVDGATLFTILLGTHKLSGDDSTVQKLATETYFLHPDYNPDTLENDIGLIKLRMPVTITGNINQLYLPYVDVTDVSVGTAFGWGQTSDSDSELADTLNYVTLRAVSDAECRITYGNQLAQNMVCFEGNYNEGTCLGDSGSPVVVRVSRGYDVAIAIASFFSSNGCESTDPSGFTKVFPYNDWIRNVTAS
jgi:secreted trypsin-like serine protease